LRYLQDIFPYQLPCVAFMPRFISVQGAQEKQGRPGKYSREALAFAVEKYAR